MALFGARKPEWLRMAAGLCATAIAVFQFWDFGAPQLAFAAAVIFVAMFLVRGRWLVLQRFDRQAQTLPSKSHFLIFDTSGMDVRRSIDLDGYFQFDAISNDGERLFLIQYINSSDYHVRVYSVSGGALDPNFVADKDDGAAAMNGLKLSGVASHDGQWLFSVYGRANQGAFIHALNLDAGFAVCLDLPGNGYSDTDRSSLDWSLALSPDGNHLYATNPALGVVTTILLNGPPPVLRMMAELVL